MSTERQRLFTMDLGKSRGSAATLTDNRTTGHLSKQKYFLRHRNSVFKMNVNETSTM
jgi:hypothetical protein